MWYFCSRKSEARIQIQRPQISLKKDIWGLEIISKIFFFVDQGKF